MASSAKSAYIVSIAQLILNAVGFIALIYTLKYNRESATASMIAASAAVDALSLERAWISRSKFNFIPFKSDFDGKPVTGYHVSIDWSNVGKTPAINVDSMSQVKVIDFGAPVPIFVADQDNDNLRDRSFAGSGDNFGSPEMIIFQEDIEQMALRNKKLFIYGRVNYGIIYDNKGRHTEICYETIIDGTINFEGRTGPRFVSMVRGKQNVML